MYRATVRAKCEDFKKSKKGTDYTISYSCNREIGIASEAGENPAVEIASGGKQYTFKIRAYQKLYPQKFYSNYDVK